MMNNVKMRQNPGFTLIELIVIMAVIAILAGIGVAGLISFRAEVELQSGISEVTTNLKSMENRARNSTKVGTGGVTSIYDLYGVIVNNVSGTYSAYYCNFVDSTKVNAVCTSIAEELFSLSGQVSVQTSGCQDTGVFFERLSGEIYMLKESGTNFTAENNAVCTLVVTHRPTGRTKSVTVDAQKNNITLN